MAGTPRQLCWCGLPRPCAGHERRLTYLPESGVTFIKGPIKRVPLTPEQIERFRVVDPVTCFEGPWRGGARGVA